MYLVENGHTGWRKKTPSFKAWRGNSSGACVFYFKVHFQTGKRVLLYTSFYEQTGNMTSENEFLNISGTIVWSFVNLNWSYCNSLGKKQLKNVHLKTLDELSPIKPTDQCENYHSAL